MNNSRTAHLPMLFSFLTLYSPLSSLSSSSLLVPSYGKSYRYFVTYS